MSLLSLLLLGSTASAADGVAAGAAAPAINAQSFRPSVDSTVYFRLTDSRLPAAGLGWRATTSWSRDPLTWTDILGEETALLRNVVQTDLAVSTTVGRARLAVDVPVLWRSAGGSVADATGLGDIVLDAKVALATGTQGLAVSGRALLPTSTVGAPLAGPLGAELELNADRPLSDRTQAALVAGVTLRGGQDMENVDWGPQLRLGAGVGHQLRPDLGLVAEVDLQPALASIDVPEGRPAEALVGANVATSRLLVRPAFAIGLTDAVSTPAWRAILAIAGRPAADTDGDGITDGADACPAAPEDADAWEDTDGCPEPTRVAFTIVDSDGQPVPDAQWSAAEQSGPSGGDGLFPAGPLTVAVGAAPVAATVPAGPPTTLVLTVPAPRGTLAVTVVDPTGAPIPGATWSATGATAVDARAAGAAPLRPGAYVVAAAATGFTAANAPVTLAAGADQALVVTLTPVRAALSATRIDLRDSVYFETAKAIIKPESYALLDEVAAILRAHPELTRVRIEGHTDSRGDAGANRRLSDARAAAVRAHLIDKGIAAERLESIGHGEDKPLVAEKTPADQARNRRVDFTIVARSDAGAATPVQTVPTGGDTPKGP